MKSRTSVFFSTLAVILLTVGTVESVRAQAPAKPPLLEQQIAETVNSINSAFMRGDIGELNTYMHEDVTMLHGHTRLNNLREVDAAWQELFVARAKAAMAYTLKIHDMKSQIYDNVIVVTFAYEHPRLAGSRISTESGMAVYVLLRQPEAVGARNAALASKKPIVMVHCAVVADRPHDPQSPLP
jgi:hypothetical protein